MLNPRVPRPNRVSCVWTREHRTCTSWVGSATRSGQVSVSLRHYGLVLTMAPHFLRIGALAVHLDPQENGPPMDGELRWDTVQHTMQVYSYLDARWRDVTSAPIRVR